MKRLNDWFNDGLTKEEYGGSMTVNKEELQSIYDRFTLSDEDRDFYQSLPVLELKAVVLTADWCGDAMLCVPIIERIAEYAGIELRYLIRDENLELMDQYLTNGTSRAIPKFIFMDQDGNEKAVWGPRSPEVQTLIDQERGKLPFKDDPAFEQKQQEMYRSFKEKLTSDQELWQSVNRSVKNQLEKLTV
ncbi:thioredoxin family protein [Fictibacillus fluitans]|uniref:Thioredoxin family protein n=1 Tax=Fictibacillus fluitans TaxID=3058422 RepID=A0ABT8HQV3_9BACL|nr:thioredoxin family protein [Fictibacillus sp. NE201]MDN4523146.1 thioredoxin family protein [Fictibacillus sp. NE201]